ncbi:MAG TPA: hypothetical protein VE620_14800 [Myxococcales bacterium]|jgi:hypothetical protein|nr:hypothetical protein [Myxococcales bacterium]
MTAERPRTPVSRGDDSQADLQPRPQPTSQARGERKYRDDEIAQILQRAAALDRKRQLEPAALSLAEVETIARESGIDPALVRQAARDLDNEREAGLGTRLAGVPVRRTFERVIDGEISADDHEQLANDIRAAMGASSMLAQVSTIGRSISWSSWTAGGVVEIQITPRDGKTTIRIDTNSAQLAGGIFGGIIGGVGGGLGANVAWIIPFALHLPAFVGAFGLAGVLVGAYGLARWAFSSRVGAVHQRLERLLETLDAHIRSQLRNDA